MENLKFFVLASLLAGAVGTLALTMSAIADSHAPAALESIVCPPQAD